MNNKNLFSYENQIFPTQPFLIKFYRGPKAEYNKRLYNILKKTQGLVNSRNRFKLLSSNVVSIEEMSSPPQCLNLLHLLTDLSKSKNILELGTFLGISAMSFALVSKKIKVTTLEKFVEFYQIAKENIKLNGFEKQINVIHGDAKISLINIKKKFDLIFIDGDKENYLLYLKLVLKNNTKSGSIIIVDNIFFHGDVFNSKSLHKKGKGAKKVLKFIEGNKKLFTSISIIPLYDGTLILKKI
ncbi:class I SAM-dependent methyltransferase [Alphaproteobacteria bacterium]|nr:class I SAM-dependent methyltransferase [Alphaproteobacteria bacterium]